MLPSCVWALWQAYEKGNHIVCMRTLWTGLQAGGDSGVTWSSSTIFTYRRMASTEDMLPSWFQLSHLALSTTFQPQGLASVQGPTVACWCSAYSTSRSSSGMGLLPAWEDEQSALRFQILAGVADTALITAVIYPGLSLHAMDHKGS